MVPVGLLPIGEVAARAGLRASAVRYYEQIGLLPPAVRMGGRRHYHESVLTRLGVIAYAKAAGFTLAQIGELVSGGGAGRRALTEAKLADVESAIRRAEARRALLQESLACDCTVLDDCPSLRVPSG